MRPFFVFCKLLLNLQISCKKETRPGYSLFPPHGQAARCYNASMDNKPTGPPLKKLPKLRVPVTNWRNPSPEELKAREEELKELSPEEAKKMAQSLLEMSEQLEMTEHEKLSPEEWKSLEKFLKLLEREK
jgi:hypothetical protein